MDGGVQKDFALRVLLAQDEPWWSGESSEWKLVLDHPWCPEDAVKPDYWQTRVLDLCEFEVTRSHFGLGYKELMEMDPDSFCKVEKRVHDIARKQAEAIPKQLKNELDKPI